MRHLATDFVVADEARETRANYLEWKNSGTKTKTSNAAIQDAAYQVSLAKQAIAHEDNAICRQIGNSSSATRLPWHKKLYFPTIVTTARLLVCEFDPKAVNPATGEIVPVNALVAEQEVLVFEYPLPRHLQFEPGNVAGAYREGIVDLSTRLHILVVQSHYLPTFLRTFYEQEAIPTEVSTPGSANGLEYVQPGAAAEALQSGTSLS